jgi:hypothetical protein
MEMWKMILLLVVGLLLAFVAEAKPKIPWWQLQVTKAQG